MLWAARTWKWGEMHGDAEGLGKIQKFTDLNSAEKNYRLVVDPMLALQRAAA